MRTLFLTAALAVTLAAPAVASGSHEGGHGGDQPAMPVGMPGEAASADRTITVTMTETEDGEMLFTPREMTVAMGETIRFDIANAGALAHEFVLDTPEGNVRHKDAMARMDMVHDDPNALRLEAGGSGVLVWTFTEAGRFEFACLIAGHYESGMHGPITVGATPAE